MHYITAKAILSSKNGMNLYRGCIHGGILHSNRRIFEYLNTFEQKEPPAQLSWF